MIQVFPSESLFLPLFLLPFLLLPMGEGKSPFQLLQACPSIPIRALAQRGRREDRPHGAELSKRRFVQ